MLSLEGSVPVSELPITLKSWYLNPDFASPHEVPTEAEFINMLQAFPSAATHHDSARIGLSKKRLRKPSQGGKALQRRMQHPAQ